MTGLPTLTPGDFPAFFKAVHELEPFPWQTRLLETVARDGEWPTLLDLPTGSGKTAAMDAALFHLALDAADTTTRRAPCRIAFVVDRRLVVDDAFARAQKIVTALNHSSDAIVRAVAARLSLLAEPGAAPLEVMRLRGGVPLDRDLARTPTQPTILCSTVDQVGSRLLFRGYGVSDRMKPIAAGLLGGDCLILLDEAHLAEPFRQTLAAVQILRNRCEATAYPTPPWSLTRLTATPGEAGGFGLSENDRQDSTLASRLNVTKRARLGDVHKNARAHLDALADEAEAAIAALQDQHITAPAVAVVVNRVARARDVHEALRHRLGESADVQLIIGPARPFDREGLSATLNPIKTGVERNLEKPMLLVATQTIEAGVDLDLDGLVTEAASLDSLRQRFGRLNRGGRDFEPHAAILAHPDDLKRNGANDPVYGPPLHRTWEQLATWAGEDRRVDFGFAAMQTHLDGAELAGLFSERMDAPVLMPAHVDLWTHTSPIPAAAPDVSLFLHGPRTSPEGVRIVWRADLDLAMPEEAAQVLTLAAPTPGEALEISLPAARAWLRGQASKADTADIAQRITADDDEGPRDRPALRWAGPDAERTGVIQASDLRPGDLIVVPANYGGCDRFGWKPASPDPVMDIGNHIERRGRKSIRLNRRIIDHMLAQSDASDPDNRDDAASSAWASVRGALTDLTSKPGAAEISRLRDALPPSLRDLLVLPDEGDITLHRNAYESDPETGEPTGFVLTVREASASGSTASSTEDDQIGSTDGDTLRLSTHSADVERVARRMAEQAGLPTALIDDLALATFLHDLGKADFRFQTYLMAGVVYDVDETRVLAKSDRVVPRDAWRKAGLPERWRHEALSVRLARAHDRFRQASDPELVLWLIGAHHGYGRPFFPHADPAEPAAEALPPEVRAELSGPLCEGPQSPAFDLDGYDWPALFAVLRRRYGAWELARLEAIVRLADHRASEYAREGWPEGWGRE